MDFIDILGWIALSSMVVYASFGIFAQVIKNFKTKSTQGLSLVMIVLSFVTFFVWFLYGVMKPDFYIAVPNLIGSIITAMILLQFWIYRKEIL